MHILGKLAKRLRAGNTPAEHLYAAAVAQARHPDFYRYQAAADSVRGRFELICLHTFLIFRRLKECGRPGQELAQALHDIMFADMDRSLREMGIGDMSVGKKVKQMAQAFYGREQAYRTGLASDDPTMLAAALGRNLYRSAIPGRSQVDAMAAYVRRERVAIAAVSFQDLQAARLRFGSAPVPSDAPADD